MGDMHGVYSTDGGQTWYFPTFNSGAQFSDFYGVTEDPSTGVLFAAAGNVNFLYNAWWSPNNTNRDGRGGGLDYSTDGGKTWSLLKQWSNPNRPTYNPVTNVVIDPSHPGRAYALVANSTNGGIWVTNNLYLADGKTVNPNATWTQLAVPSHTFTAAFTYGGQQYAAGTYYARDPYDLKVLNDGTLVAVFDVQYDSTNSYIIPTSGVWISTDGGTTWTDRQQSEPDPKQHDVLLAEDLH